MALRTTAILTALLFVAAGNLAQPAEPANAVDPLTTVSLTFDDNLDSQTSAVDTMNRLGLKGTFFVTTGFVDQPGFLSVPQLTAIRDAGHEIGGHSVTHPDLTTVTAAAAKREVCDGRATLADWGFRVTSFAYPFAAVSDSVEAATADCGFNTARGLGDIESRFGCDGCGFAETIPPVNAYYTKAVDMVTPSWTLADLQASVTNAEQNGGGWVQLTFHDICDNACTPQSISPALFTEFAEWLAPRAATNNTVVKTVDQVIGGDVKPISTVGSPPPAGPGVNAVVNPGLETPGTGGLPQCWALAGFGVNSANAVTVSPGRTGNSAVKLTMSGYVDGDAKLMVINDLGDCAPTVVPGKTYSMRAWYNSTVPTQFDVSLRNADGAWSYWTSSPYFAASGTYAQAVWQTPAVPAGFTGIRFGLNLFQDGELTTDDYALYASEGAPPTNSLVAGTPTISGTAKVGETLTANPGTWSPAGTTFGYQWLANGGVIAGATANTYRPVAADVSKRISVRVTGTNSAATPTSSTVTSAETAAVVAATPPPTTVTVDRLAGADRFATAVEISKTFSPGVAKLYIATGYGFADALSAAPAAAKFSSPLLLTKPTELPANVRAEIVRLKPREIVVVGGTGVVSNAVFAQLRTLAPTKRVAGLDRYETSRAVTVDAFGTSAPATAYIATGQNFPDALAAAPAAARYSGPLLLVRGSATTVDAATKSLLTSLKVKDVKIAGGPGAVSSGIEASLKPSFTVKRNGGENRYGTAAAINREAFASSDRVYLAVGTNFADALVGGALAGKNKAPLYLTPSACLDQGAKADITRLGATKVTLLGGTGVLSEKVARLESC